LQGADDFYQGHHGHGVEKVHANKTVSTRGGGSEFGNGDR